MATFVQIVSLILLLIVSGKAGVVTLSPKDEDNGKSHSSPGDLTDGTSDFSPRDGKFTMSNSSSTHVCRQTPHPSSEVAVDETLSSDNRSQDGRMVSPTIPGLTNSSKNLFPATSHLAKPFTRRTTVEKELSSVP